MSIVATLCMFLSPLAIWLIAGGKDCPKRLKVILIIVQIVLFLIFLLMWWIEFAG